jgi:hypothetical protein
MGRTVTLISVVLQMAETINANDVDATEHKSINNIKIKNFPTDACKPIRK